MKKKISVVFLTLFGLTIIGISILYFFRVFNPPMGGILIDSEPGSSVFINNKEVGKTPYEATLSPTEITIRIKPDTINGQPIDDYETKTKLVSGIKTIIKRIFKETEAESSGVVVSFEKISGSDGLVTVVSIPDNAQVIVDNKIYGYTPLKIKISEGNHNLIISAEKYFEKSLPIVVVKGYELTASVKLAKMIDPLPTSTPNPVPKEQIEILNTNIGYLRAREGAGINFPEVFQVKPGEIYEILETNEDKDWYKITVNEIEGWVSGEFVKKVTD